MDSEQELSGGVAVENKVQLPHDYKCILINDDYTTKDFVVDVLRRVFHKTGAEAVAIMETVHKSGKGVAGIYTWDIAVTKANKTMSLAREQGFPLRCEVESI